MCLSKNKVLNTPQKYSFLANKSCVDGDDDVTRNHLEKFTKVDECERCGCFDGEEVCLPTQCYDKPCYIKEGNLSGYYDNRLLTA